MRDFLLRILRLTSAPFARRSALTCVVLVRYSLLRSFRELNILLYIIRLTSALSTRRSTLTYVVLNRNSLSYSYL